MKITSAMPLQGLAWHAHAIATTRVCWSEICRKLSGKFIGQNDSSLNIGQCGVIQRFAWAADASASKKVMS